MQLWLENTLILKHKSNSKNVKLKKGVEYPIRVTFMEHNKNAYIKLFWSCEDFEKQIVPSRVLWTADKAENGLSARYSSDGYRLCYTQKDGSVYANTLDWIDKIVINHGNVDKVTGIELLGNDKDIVWEVNDGKIVIDTTDFGYDDMPCEWAWVFKLNSR